MQTIVIAEIGVNHNGSIELAETLIRRSVESGASHVKFQLFDTAKLVGTNAPLSDYQKEPGLDSQFDLLKPLELSQEAITHLRKVTEDSGGGFLATPFDLDSLAFLLESGVKTVKVGSGDLTDYFLLNELARAGVDVILSTGMSTMAEVSSAVRLLTDQGMEPESISLLHCTSAYPAPDQELNLRVIQTLRDEFGVRAGYSDHTTGILAAPIAVAMGAQIIEKHITLDRQMKGPDHSSSIEPDEFREMCDTIQIVEQMLGSSRKEVTPSEFETRRVARKSLVAQRNIARGERFTMENLVAKRPGSGISPMELPNVIRLTSSSNFKEGDEITL